jgi:endogenous inhibitor of DNA gyrase (YacG/DUF329 family)
MIGLCQVCGERHPVAFARRVGGRLRVECPRCDARVEVDYAGTRPLPCCLAVVDIRPRSDRLRVIKARKWGTCATCQKPTLPGQHIARGDSGWSHVSCVVETQPTEGATDGRRP